jgi:predicted ATPase
MFCDMVGFTAAMQDDEQSALADRDRYRTVIEDLHNEFGGEIVQYYGDGTLSIFSNSADAVRCAVAIQQTLSGEPVVPVRVGVHVGDVVVEEHGLLGDAVNVASRIESFGQPGAVLVSDSVQDLVKNQPDLELVSLGEFHLDNVARPYGLFAVDADGLMVPGVSSLVGKGLPVVDRAELSNLPVQVTSFVGRVQESAELEKLIRGSRLVTVTGAGGCGKSRLAVHVAAGLMDEYPDGVWLVELASLSDGRLLASMVANVLGVQEEPGTDTLDVLTGYLGEKQVLLVVDNCEHLIEPVADLVAHLLTHTTDLRVVATSREPLHVRGEAVYHLPTLPVPDEEDDWETLTHTDSVRLFAERAEAAYPGFRVTHDNGDTVASICRRLDGIPLAVELASSVTRVFTPEQIDERLGDRFRLLTGGPRGDVQHHRTLEATIDWSYKLLTAEQRAIFARLSVFAGPFTIRAAEQVCTDETIPAEEVARAMVQLADRSLIEVEHSEAGTQYRMLETIRSFAASRFRVLPNHIQQNLWVQHFRFFLACAEEAAEGPISAQPLPAWLTRLDHATPDLRQALKWAVDGGHDQEAVELAGALGWFWRVRDRRSEARHWFESIPLVSTEVSALSLSRALRFAAAVLSGSGTGDVIDRAAARSLAEESLRLAQNANDPASVAASLEALCHIALGGGDSQESLAVIQRAMEAAKTAGDRWREARIRHYLALHRGPGDDAKTLLRDNLVAFQELGDDRMAALTMGFLGDFDGSREMLEESLQIGRKLQDAAVMGNALGILAGATYREGDFETAKAYFEEMHDLYWRVRKDVPAQAILGLGAVAFATGDLASSEGHIRRALNLLTGSSYASIWGAALKLTGLQGVARILVRRQSFFGAAETLAAVDSALESTPARAQYFGGGFDSDLHQDMIAEVRSASTDDSYLQAHQRGAAMSLDDAIDYALNLLGDA